MEREQVLINRFGQLVKKKAEYDNLDWEIQKEKIGKWTEKYQKIFIPTTLCAEIN